MKKITNSTHLEGYLFGHTLEAKVTGPTSKVPGTEFISGTIEIMTDDAGLNVVPVNYRYVTEKTKAGKDNATYKTLMSIIQSPGKTFQDVGTAALKVKADTALGLNDFYNAQNELVTYKLNDGGFVHLVPTLTDNRNTFEVDMLINNVVVREADADKGWDEVMFVKGATFNFMGSILPIDLVVRDAGGMKFFENLGATPAEPVFMKVWGQVLSSTVETQTIEESAFGGPAVKTSTRRLREWVINGASTEPYDFGDDKVLTRDEVTKAIAAREVYLAETKTRHDEYIASKGGAATPATPAGAVTADKKPFVF